MRVQGDGRLAGGVRHDHHLFAEEGNAGDRLFLALLRAAEGILVIDRQGDGFKRAVGHRADGRVIHLTHGEVDGILVDIHGRRVCLYGEAGNGVVNKLRRGFARGGVFVRVKDADACGDGGSALAYGGDKAVFVNGQHAFVGADPRAVIAPGGNRRIDHVRADGIAHGQRDLPLRRHEKFFSVFRMILHLGGVDDVLDLRGVEHRGDSGPVPGGIRHGVFHRVRQGNGRHAGKIGERIREDAHHVRAVNGLRDFDAAAVILAREGERQVGAVNPQVGKAILIKEEVHRIERDIVIRSPAVDRAARFTDQQVDILEGGAAQRRRCIADNGIGRAGALQNAAADLADRCGQLQAEDVGILEGAVADGTDAAGQLHNAGKSAVAFKGLRLDGLQPGRQADRGQRAAERKHKEQEGKKQDEGLFHDGYPPRERVVAA